MPNSVAEAATFICGHPKTGTSLLLTLLDSHPELIVYPEETGYFRWFAEYTQGYSLDQKAALASQLLEHGFHWDPRALRSRDDDFPDRDYADVPYDRVRGRFEEYLKRLGLSEANILSAAMMAFGEVSGQLGPRTKRWVEKTPYHELFADQIFKLWPEAKCIQLVRDPRDTYSSYRRKHTEWTPEVMAYAWDRSTRLGMAHRARYGAGRYLILRYEDLVENLKNTLAEVRQFLGIADDLRLYQPTRAGKPWGGNSMFGESFEGVSRRPIGRYRSALTESETQLLDVALRKHMRRFGYAIDTEYSFGAWARWQAYRIRRWLGEVRQGRRGGV